MRLPGRMGTRSTDHSNIRPTRGRMASAGAARADTSRMFQARVLSLTVARPARPARRPAAAGKRAGARRLSHWLGRRRRAR